MRGVGSSRECVEVWKADYESVYQCNSSGSGLMGRETYNGGSALSKECMDSGQLSVL
jgi:hypothetical protein